MKICNLKKSYGNFTLHIDELELLPGRIYGLIGPNGCGKSTLMKLMAGVIDSDSGSVEHLELSARDITMISRKPFFLHDNVLKNLVYPLSLRKIKPQPCLIDEYLELAGLKGKEKHYAPTLSGGEQQKLALARAFIFSPKLILIDEAFTNLDIESIALFEDFILKRQEDTPITWLIISHQLSYIRRMCDYVYFMHDGEIVAEGATEEILLRPSNDLLKKYIQFEALG